ncbi:MAG TPA: hypothetical protein VGC00_00670 [Thermoanaerobaculia bacterium]
MTPVGSPISIGMRTLRSAGPEVALAALSLAPRGELPSLDAFRFVALLWVVARIGDRARRRFLPELAGAEALLAAFCLAAGATIAALTWLGAVGLLWYQAAGPALAATSLGLRRASPLSGDPSVASPGAPEPARERSEAMLLAFVGALVVATVAVEMQRHRYTPPGVYTYDEVSYHLPAAAIWLRYGDLRTPKPPFGDPATPFYPLAGELVSWLLISPFGDSDLFARWTELPAGLALLLATYVLGRRFALSRAAVCAAMLLALTVPRLVPQLFLSAGNDVWNGLAVLATLFALHLWCERPGARRAAFFGVCLGLLVGVKYLGLLELVVLVPVGAVAFRLRPSWRESAVALGVAAGVGGFAYLRNLFGTGNPVFPQTISFAGIELLPGLAGAGLGERDIGAAARSVEPLGFLLTRIDLFGRVWRWIALPAAVLAPLVALARGGRSERRSALWMVIAPALFVLWVMLIHDHRDLRFLVAPLVLTLLSFGWLLDRLDARDGGRLASAGALVVAGLVVASHADERRWLAGAALALVASLFWSRARAWPSARLWQLARCGAAVAALALVLLLPAWTSKYRRLRARYQPVAAELARLTGGRSVRIAYVGGNQPYFLFGDRLQNSVHAVPPAGPVEEQYWDFGRTVAFPPRHRTSRAFAKNVNQLGITWMVVERSGVEFPERSMVADWRHWRLAARVDGAELWRVRP